jgi:hypothetical protein
MGRRGLDCSGSVLGRVVGYADTVVDFMVLLNAGDIFEYLSDCQLFRKDTGSWTWFLRVSIHNSCLVKFN